MRFFQAGIEDVIKSTNIVSHIRKSFDQRAYKLRATISRRQLFSATVLRSGTSSPENNLLKYHHIAMKTHYSIWLETPEKLY